MYSVLVCHGGKEIPRDWGDTYEDKIAVTNMHISLRTPRRMREHCLRS